MTTNQTRPISVAGFKREAGGLSDAVHETGRPLAVLHGGAVMATVRRAGGPPTKEHPLTQVLREEPSEYDGQENRSQKKRKRGGMAGTVTFNISDEELIYFNTFDPKNYR